LQIWLPLISGAALLLRMFLGMSIQSHRDSNTDAVAAPAPAAMPAQTNHSARDDGDTADSRKQQHRDKDRTLPSNGPHEE